MKIKKAAPVKPEPPSDREFPVRKIRMSQPPNKVKPELPRRKEEKGSAQANINMGTFENERFPFPPVAEQKQIVAKLDALSEETQRLANIYERKLAALEALKKSLLHRAFSGEM